MGKSRKNRQFFWITVLLIAAMVSAWLLPASVGIAAGVSGKLKVSVSGVDSVGVNIGKSAVRTVPNHRAGEAVTRLVTQVTSFQLSDGFSLVDSVQGRSWLTNEIMVTVVDL